MQTLKLFLIGLNLARCDLIGFNRLGNNIMSHNRFGEKSKNANLPRFQFAFLTEKLSPSETLRLMQLQVLQTRRGPQRPSTARRQNRRKLYLKHYRVKQ